MAGYRNTIRRVGLVGGGLIGGGWAARFLLNGRDVDIYDPDPRASEKLDALLTNARAAWAALFADRTMPEGRIRFVASLDDLAADADFIQESIPERVDLKQEVLADLSKRSPADVLIASSTSGIRPTLLQEYMQHPERLLVGHPFNPVYLLPLVELCPGQATSDYAVAAADAFYRSLGMKPLKVRQEIDGFIADRLMEALWREALWLVNDGVATAEEVDTAITYGAGLRWAQMGTFLTFRTAGGEAGMRHFMEQFGPCLQWPWTKLMDVPELTDDLLDKIVAQSDDQAAGRSVHQLEQQRDANLVTILKALQQNNWGAGETLNNYLERSDYTER